MSNTQKREYGLLALLIVGFGLVYLSLCFNDNIWTDEAFTIDLLRNCKTYGEAVWFTAGDVHPPLYYIIVKAVTDLFGLHLFVLKVASIVPMLLTMGFGGCFAYRRLGFRVAFLWMLLFGAIPCGMEYAVQVRMYAWAMFFVTVCGFSTVDCYDRENKRDWIWFGVAGVASAYTHYFAFVSVLWIYGFLFLAICAGKRKKLARFAVTAGLSFLAYTPWLRIVKAQVSGVSKNYWIGAIDKEVVLGYLDTLFATNLPYSTGILTVLFVGTGVALTLRFLRQRKLMDGVALLGALVLVLTAAFGVAVSLLMRPVFIARYLMPCVPIFCLFFAVFWGKAEKKLYAALLGLVLCLGMVTYEHTWQAEYQSTKVPEMEQLFAEQLGENDLIVYNYKLFDFIYLYYFDADRMCYIEDLNLDGPYDQIWFLDTQGNPEFSEEDLAMHGWKRTLEGNYGIEHNEFKIYRLSKN